MNFIKKKIALTTRKMCKIGNDIYYIKIIKIKMKAQTKGYCTYDSEFQ